MKLKKSIFVIVSCLLLLVMLLPLSAKAESIEDKQFRATELQNRISILEVELQECVTNRLAAQELANSARVLEIAEDDIIIVRAKDLWSLNNYRCEELQNQISTLKNEFSEVSSYLNMSYVGDFKLTGYCACYKCCGKSPSSPGYGITAMGTRVTENKTIAMDKRFPLGTKVYIEGLGIRIVEDRGGAIKGNRVDVYVPTHAGCFDAKYNTTAEVYVVNE